MIRQERTFIPGTEPPDEPRIHEVLDAIEAKQASRRGDEDSPLAAHGLDRHSQGGCEPRPIARAVVVVRPSLIERDPLDRRTPVERYPLMSYRCSNRDLRTRRKVGS